MPSRNAVWREESPLAAAIIRLISYQCLFWLQDLLGLQELVDQI